MMDKDLAAKFRAFVESLTDEEAERLWIYIGEIDAVYHMIQIIVECHPNIDD